MNRVERNKYVYSLTHKIINEVEYKKCSVCKEWKIMSEEYYYKWNQSKDGFESQCKECKKERQREYQREHKEDNNRRCKEHYYANLERQKKKHNDYKETHREECSDYYKDWCNKDENKKKLQQYNKNHRIHDITKTEEEALLKVFNYQCAYCGITQEEHKKKYRQKLHNDHVDDEEYNDLRNDVPACKSCNSKKHQYDMETWFRQQSFFTEDKYNKIIWWITEGYKKYIEDKLPYRILRERDEGLTTYHFNLWSVDEKRNLVEIIATEKKRKYLNIHIKDYLNRLKNKTK